MPEKDGSRTTQRLLAAILVILAAGTLKLAKPVVIALLLTVLLVYVIDPLVVFLQRRRLPLWLSVLLAVAFFASLFFGLGILIFFDLVHFGKTFQKFQEQLLAMANSALLGFEKSIGMDLAFDPLEELRSFQIGSIVMSSTRSMLSILSQFVLIFFFAIILLVGKYRVIRVLLAVFPRRKSMVPLMLMNVDRHLRMFLGIKTLSSIAIGIGTALLLLAFRVEYAVTWGFLAVILNFIPALGPAAAVLLPFLISLVQFDAFLRPMIIALSLAAVHVGVSNFLEPKFMGERLSLSFFVIFLSLFFWGWMWGAAGVLLAVPVTASLKIVLEGFPATARFALLLRRSASRKIRMKIRGKS